MGSYTDAPGPSLGYMYQAYYALLLLLTSDNDTKIYIEKLEDIQLQSAGDAREALQLKHSIQPNPKKLTNRSLDLWKTIGNWSEKLKSGDLDDVRLLSLITVTETSPNSIPKQLEMINSQRDNQQIVQELMNVVSDILNKEHSEEHSLSKHLMKFQALSPTERFSLINRIQITSQSPDINNIENKIKNKLAVHPAFRDAIYEKLVGWWMEKVREHLINQSRPIQHEDLNIRLAEIQEEYHRDNLPLDFEDAVLTDDVFESEALQLFVKQLTLISVEEKTIENAIRDYFRAFSERNKWLDEQLIDWHELNRYERELIEHWEAYCDAVRADIEIYLDGDADDVKFGKKVYHDLMISEIPRIRRLVSARYIQRGSYHILANELEPRVWWHPRFVEHLKEILSPPLSDAEQTKQEDAKQENLQSRPIEIANLVNPAFGTVVLYEGIKGYMEATKSTGIPYVLIYFLFPLVFNKSIRETLPRSSKSKLQSWVQNHPEHIPYIQRTFGEYEILTNEALRFGIRKNTLAKVDGQLFTYQTQKRLMSKKYAGEFETDVNHIRISAKKVGKLLAQAANEVSVYFWFGVTIK